MSSHALAECPGCGLSYDESTETSQYLSICLFDSCLSCLSGKGHITEMDEFLDKISAERRRRDEELSALNS